MPPNQAVVDNNKGSNNTLKVVIIVIVVLLLLCVCCGISVFALPLITSTIQPIKTTNSATSMEQFNYSSPVISESTVTSTAPVTSTDAVTKVYALNEKYTSTGNLEVTIVTYDDNVPAKSSFYNAKSGYKYMAFEVLMTNKSNNSYYYSTYEWSVSDKDGFNYDESFFNTKEPDLSSGTLAKGETVRGWVTFEVKNNSTELYAQFVPLFKDAAKFRIK